LCICRNGVIYGSVVAITRAITSATSASITSAATSVAVI
jgi:hypothetical protein